MDLLRAIPLKMKGLGPSPESLFNDPPPPPDFLVSLDPLVREMLAKTLHIWIKTPISIQGNSGPMPEARLNWI